MCSLQNQHSLEIGQEKALISKLELSILFKQTSCYYHIYQPLRLGRIGHKVNF